MSCLAWLAKAARCPTARKKESGSVIASDGRVYFWWTGWDAEQGQPTFKYWDEVKPDSSWDDDAEYVRACELLEMRGAGPS